MTMTDWNYPPTRTLTLAQARDRLDEQLADCDDGGEQDRLETLRSGVTWAIDQFGADTTIELTAFTARERDRTLDTLREQLVGVGDREMQQYFLAAQIETAPWLDDDMDLIDHGRVIGELPPAVVDWLQSEADDLNALDEGN
jgi:hypothetical protein